MFPELNCSTNRGEERLLKWHRWHSSPVGVWANRNEDLGGFWNGGTPKIDGFKIPLDDFWVPPIYGNPHFVTWGTSSRVQVLLLKQLQDTTAIMRPILSGFQLRIAILHICDHFCEMLLNVITMWGPPSYKLVYNPNNYRYNPRKP